MFRPYSGEKPDGIIARWELLRLKSRREAGLDMSWTGYAFLIVNALGVPIKSLPNLLIPLGGQLPSTQADYTRLLALLRQNEHYRDPNSLRPGDHRDPRSKHHFEDAGVPRKK